MSKLYKIIFLSGFITQAFSADLMDVYHHALENDTIFKQAYSTYQSNQEAVPQAFSALLPQLVLTGNASRNHLETVLSSNQPISQNYSSKQWQISASQAVFNYAAWAQVQQARASVKAAQATFNDAAQDLIIRTASAYLDVLYAKDTLAFAQAKKKANYRQLEQARQRFKVGLDAITSVYEAQAAYDQSVSDLIAARYNQVNQNENLSVITNYTYDSLAPLRAQQVPLIKPVPLDVNTWINTGLKQNYNLKTAQMNLISARENIKVQTAGNWPVLSLQANQSGVINSVPNAGANFFVPSKQLNENIALNVNFPILQGGLVASETRQAQYNFQATSEQYNRLYRQTITNTRITFNTILEKISKIKADEQTIRSSKNSVESTEAQFTVGTRTMVDVVNAQQKLFEAQQQRAYDQYTFIKSILNLKYLAGTLTVADLEQVNSFLATTRTKIDRSI